MHAIISLAVCMLSLRSRGLLYGGAQLAGMTHWRDVRARVTDLGITCMLEASRGGGEACALTSAKAED